MAHDAFISYSKKDKEVADAICKALEDDGLSCWYAPRDVAFGADWDASIMEALGKSRVMILVWSSNSDSSKQVKRELALAIDDLEVSLIPFRTEIIEPSKLRYYLGNIQWLDASSAPLENSLRLLVKHVRIAIAQKEPTAPEASISGGANRVVHPPSQPIPESPLPSSTPRPPGDPDAGSTAPAFPLRLILVGVGALVLIVVGLAYAFWPTANDRQNPIAQDIALSDEVASPAPTTPEPLGSAESAFSTPAAESSARPLQVSTPASSTPGNSNEPDSAPLSAGTLDDKALNLPTPEVPPIARQAGAYGTVVVQVTIDEYGRVISAEAISGNPLLQAAAVDAARRASFAPTIISGQPVKVTGVINYRFRRSLKRTPVPTQK